MGVTILRRSGGSSPSAGLMHEFLYASSIWLMIWLTKMCRVFLGQRTKAIIGSPRRLSPITRTGHSTPITRSGRTIKTRTPPKAGRLIRMARKIPNEMTRPRLRLATGRLVTQPQLGNLLLAVKALAFQAEVVRPLVPFLLLLPILVSYRDCGLYLRC